MGMVLYEMLTLQLPYKEVGLFDVRSHILKGTQRRDPKAVLSSPVFLP